MLLSLQKSKSIKSSKTGHREQVQLEGQEPLSLYELYGKRERIINFLEGKGRRI